MGIFKTKRNKRFSYEPQYYKSGKEGSPYEMERKFDKYRRATGDEAKGLKAKFAMAIEDFKSGSDKTTRNTILIIIAILILVFLFIIDFDLSIFRNPL